MKAPRNIAQSDSTTNHNATSKVDGIVFNIVLGSNPIVIVGQREVGGQR
jgi:hypothetical protein